MSRSSVSSSPRRASSATSPSRPSGSRSSRAGSMRQAGFPFRPFTADARVAWIEGRELADRSAGSPAGRARLSRARDSWSAQGRSATRRAAGSPVARREDAAVARAVRAARARRVHDRVGEPALAAARRIGRAAGRESVFERPGLRFAAVDLSVDPPGADDPRRRPRAGGLPRRARRRGRRSADRRAGLVEGARRGVRRALGRAPSSRCSIPTGISARAVSGSRRSTITSSTTPITIAPAPRRSSTRAPSGRRRRRSRRSRAVGPAEWVAALCGRVDAAGSTRLRRRRHVARCRRARPRR